jgi:Holliday junction DNA helicase RuvA
VIEAAGVGYAINIALPTYSELVGKEGQESRLYITEIIREDAHELFGFFSKGERELFVMLMTVSGIGANTARMIMSAYSAAEIRQIIATGNARALSQVKGLGPKTAQRIIVDLKDKVLKVDLGNEAQGERLEAMGLLGEEASIVDSAVKQEAVSALVMLGFAAAASGKVVDKILKTAPESSVEQVIKQALKML